jgi:hypothetical protein
MNLYKCVGFTVSVGKGIEAPLIAVPCMAVINKILLQALLAGIAKRRENPG